MNNLMAMKPEIVDGYLVVPVGMTPVYLHFLKDRWIVYVEGWTPEGEFNASGFNAYPLAAAREFTVSVSGGLDDYVQSGTRWYDSFGKPTKEAMKNSSGFIF